MGTVVTQLDEAFGRVIQGKLRIREAFESKFSELFHLVACLVSKLAHETRDGTDEINALETHRDVLVTDGRP